MVLLRVLAALTLTLCPGAWAAFARRSDSLPLTARFAIAGALSPVIAAVEFLVLRWFGVAVPTAAWALIALNLPAVWLILRRSPTTVSPMAWSSAGQWVCVLALLAAGASIPWHTDAQLRMLESHTWMHSSMVTEFVTGRLLPEDPELAGIGLGYPWVSHAYWATLGVVAGWAPTRTYVLTNLMWIVWTSLAVYSASVALGASGASARASVLWLMLGTNALGLVTYWMTGWLPGDVRYTPWLRKFTSFNDMPFALALLTSLVVLTIRASRRTTRRDPPWLFALVLGATGTIYPLMLPAVLAVSGAMLLIIGVETSGGSGGRHDLVAYGSATGAGVVATLTALSVTAAARDGSGIAFSLVGEMASKLASAAIALAPMIVSVGLVIWRRPRTARESTVTTRIDNSHAVLGIAACGLVLANALFHLQGSAYNEYKLIICAAAILAPMIAVAFDRIATPRWSGLTIVVVSGGLLAPAVLGQNVSASRRMVDAAPAAVESGVTVHLNHDADEAAWTDAVRQRTPKETVLVVGTSRVFVPAVTERSLYAPIPRVYFPGVWLESRENLIGLRGYPRRMVDERIERVRRLLASAREEDAASSWAEIVKLERPIAVLAHTSEQRALLAWLESHAGGQAIFNDASGRVVWFSPTPARAVSAVR